MNKEKPTIESLQAEINELNIIIVGLENTSKMLVRRDLDLKKAHNNLKSLDKEKTDFVAIAAHQLRTPLTTTMWAHKMFLEGDTGNLTSKQKDLAERSFASVKHMHALVEELIQVDKLEYGNTELKIQSGNIQKLIETILAEHTLKIAEANLTINKNYSYAEPISFDPYKLSDALGNLINNAVKYTPDNGKISITIIKKASNVYIEITDNGIGVPIGEESRLFHKFSRIKNAEQVDAGGSGLGLYIAKKIIEKHKGTLTFSHNDGPGSTFTVKIPC
ncbi:MAG: HAMP domain-containing histidine kinase [Candidatus Pacebacteria bacterium]|nr:HAMP domain-containing histidine kinase [Candidatus Paceibacterota bacterium]